MAPEFHRQMIDQRSSDLRRQAAEYRRARQAQETKDEQGKRSSGERRRSLFGKPASA